MDCMLNFQKYDSGRGEQYTSGSVFHQLLNRSKWRTGRSQEYRGQSPKIHPKCIVGKQNPWNARMVQSQNYNLRHKQVKR